MAGTVGGFNSREFRDGIQFAMTMGAAPVVDRQATFFFPAELVYTGPADDSTLPFDPTATVTRVTPPGVRVPCAIEYFDRVGEQTDFGYLTASKVKITLLDEDHVKVEGCEYVVIDGDRYNYTKTQPPSGLFDVGLFELWFTAENET